MLVHCILTEACADRILAEVGSNYLHLLSYTYLSNFLRKNDFYEVSLLLLGKRFLLLYRIINTF